MLKISGKLYFVGAFILAGTSVVTMNFLAGNMGPFTIIIAGTGLSVIFIAPFRLKTMVEALRKMRFSDWRMLFLQAMFGIFLFRVLLLWGLKHTSASEAGILIGAIPAFTTFLAFALLKEDLSAKAISGILCTVVGIMLLQGLGTAEFTSSNLYGNILILMAAASESAFNIFSRKSSLEQASLSLDPMCRTILVCALAFSLCLFPAALEDPLNTLRSLNLSSWLALIWQSLFVTVISYYFWFAGIKRCSAYTGAAFSGLMPLTAMTLSIIIFNEPLTIAKIMGCIGIIGGLALLAK